jgi:hypothetical protein
MRIREQEHMAAQRVAFEPVTHQPEESFEPFAHIRGARCNVDVCSCTDAEHLLQPLEHTHRFSEGRPIETFRQLDTPAARQQYGHARFLAARLRYFHPQQPRLVRSLSAIPADVSVQSLQSDTMLLGELTPRQPARPELSNKLCGFSAAPVTTDACLALPFGHVSSVRPWTATRPDVVAQTHTFNKYFDEALRLVKDVPGVEAAGLTDVLPLGRNRTWGAGAKGQIYPKGQYPTAFVRIVTDGYFGAMGIPIRSGRDFTQQDRPDTKKVIIINEALASRLWPGESPIGKVMAQQDREVIGVVGNVRHIALEKESGSEMYIPMRQSNDHPTIDLVVRTRLPPAQLASAVRNAIRPIEPNLPANEFRTLTQLVDKAVSSRRFVVTLLAGFAGFALILASLGIYAVISYSVQQRRQEIGIRMALGASPWDLQWRILSQTLGLAAIGMSIGTAAAIALARTMSGLLYGVTASDPVSFGLMLMMLPMVAALAGYVPARRASRTDPMVTLRAD